MSDNPRRRETTHLPPGFTRHDATVNGTRLSYLIGGTGEPVLLLHGWPQTARSWHPVLRPLAAQGYTVIAPDLRGLGQSDRADSGYEKDNQVEDMRQLLRNLGFGPRVRVVGHDIGGMIAFSWARKHPEEVERLVLIELAVPGFGLEQAMNVAEGGRWHFGFFMTPEVPELLLGGHEREFFAWWFAHLSGDPDAFSSDEIDAVTADYAGHEALRAGFGHYRTLLRDAAANRAWYDGGGRLDMPVLAIGGELAVGQRLAESIRAAAPHARAAVVQACGHFVADERPEDLIRILTQFLAQVPAA
ncbi:alpha/beta fold hydrolase [Frankia gtarii]|uniref:alpha/beta fold hydrolase n=1 Tax=Frankia gtarii TaxID=2950102 RepID=UPI0021BE3CC8|nr:alpha/beta hydrolase [Frankia gtarii]